MPAQPEASEPIKNKLSRQILQLLITAFALLAVVSLGMIAFVLLQSGKSLWPMLAISGGLVLAAAAIFYVLVRRFIQHKLDQRLGALLADTDRLLADGQPIPAQPEQELDNLADRLNNLRREVLHFKDALSQATIDLEETQEILEAQVLERNSELRVYNQPLPVDGGQTRILTETGHDELTGLVNRAEFMKEMTHVLEETPALGEVSEKGLTALLFIDLDQFKVVNDSLGHVIGDELLVAVAARLKNNLANRYLLSRFGGDEFVILLHDARSIKDAENLAQNILDWMNQPFKLGDQDVYCSVSIGIALTMPGEKDPVSLLRDADTAVFRAKSNGRNRYEVFSERMHLRARRLLKLEAQIRQAIEDNEFRIYYQPIFNAQTRQINSLEALIRWKHPSQGFLLPQDFIPLAEESGLIKLIDYWVIGSVCSQIKAWQESGAPSVPVTVNISGQSIMDPETPGYFKTQLQQYDLPALAVDIEISEEAAMKHFDISLQTISRLNQIGVSCWMDDFGQAYSSLSHLRYLPVKTIKIPSLFIHNAEQNQAILKAIIDMSHALNMKVCAEGVETEGQVAILSALECDMMQGYLFAPPLPLKGIEEFFVQQQEQA